MNEMIAWTDVGTIADVPRQGARTVEHPMGRIAVFRTLDDRVFALWDRCPHRDGPLSQGIVHGHAVTCPLHNWVIDLATGVAAGADEGCAGTIPLKVIDGRIRLGLSLRKAAGRAGVADG